MLQSNRTGSLSHFPISPKKRRRGIMHMKIGTGGKNTIAVFI